jgi:hypothetical protein
MVCARIIRLAFFCLLAVRFASLAWASDFTAFAEDEDVCRRVGAAAIGGGVGPAAAQRYDAAYGRCMFAHGRMRRMGGDPQGGPGGPPAPNVHAGEFPDAFYSIPYATPGYGYDGFSP